MGYIQIEHHYRSLTTEDNDVYKPKKGKLKTVMKIRYQHSMRNIIILSSLFSIAFCGSFYFLNFSHALLIPIASVLIFCLPVLVGVLMHFLRKKENDLNESKRLFTNTMGNVNVGMGLLSKDGHWSQANVALCKMLDYSKDELEKLTIQDITYPDDLSNTVGILNILNSGEQQYYNTEKRCLSKTGKTIWVHLSVAAIFNNNERPEYFMVLIENITQEKSLQSKMNFTTTHDELTGLLNRREFEKSLNNVVKDLKTHPTQHVLCYLDLDFFKIINYVEGHLAGDALLREVARLLHNSLRKEDILARLGGDEFGILFSNTSLISGKERCQQLIKLVSSTRFPWNKNTYHVDTSIGMVIVDDNTRSPSQLLSDADLACYAAKSEGRNRVFIYQSDQPESLEYKHKIVLANTIKEILERDRLLIYAQKISPIHALQSTDTSYELLLRLVDDNQNIVSASAFVETAERFNLMGQIDRWVLTQVLTRRDKTLSALDVTYFSMNLSANALNDPDFLPFLLDLIKRSSLKPERLCFEITETAAMTRIMNTAQLMRDLRCLGCKIALDDFGAGLSSFSYLKNFLVDIIKIDGSFIKNVALTNLDKIIVQTINTMAHSLNMKTIGEYVENDEILKVITEIGLDYAQGYGIGKPEPINDILQ